MIDQTPEPSEKNITVSNGESSVRLECADQTLARYSRMFDENGKEYPGIYEKNVKVYDKPTTWKCLYMKWGQMWEVETNLTVIKQGK